MKSFSVNIPRAGWCAFFFGLFGFALLQTAWVTEDAFITFRTVDNFIHGYGLTWNVAERVQTYTHPLWMLLLVLADALTHELYFSTIALSVLCSFGALALFAFRIARQSGAAVIGLLIFIFSKAFVEYSTSGLENPLTHLLSAGFLLFHFRREPSAENDAKTLFILSFWAGLATLNRMDTLLLFLPALVTQIPRKRPLSALLAITAGFSPFIGWMLFAFFYYGTPFPNTAFAKLNTGIGAPDLLRQGGYYLLDSLTRDPLTLAVIFLGLITFFRQTDRSHTAIRVGMLLYLLYILKIGGDFMSGRFLTPVLFCAVSLLSRQALDWKQGLLSIPVIAALGLAADFPPLLARKTHGLDIRGIVNDHGISDERRAYYPYVGLRIAWTEDPFPAHPWAQTGRQARSFAEQPDQLAQSPDGITLFQVGTTVGMYGFFAGPHVYLVDELALGDPLLSRLPMLQEDWRPGHYKRSLPLGYIETLVLRRNKIPDPNLAAFYARLEKVVRGPLFDRGRLRAIWDLNLGRYDHFIRQYVAANQSTGRVPYFQDAADQAAVERFLAERQVDPNTPERYAQFNYRLGRLYERRRDFTSAAEEYTVSLALYPFYVPALNAAARLSVEIGRFGEAIDYLTRIGRIAPNKPEIDYNIACLHARLHQPEAALAWLRKAMTKGYNNKNKLLADPDLEPVRAVSGFKDLISEIPSKQ